MFHQGVVKDNGFVDNKEIITDPETFQTRASDDGMHLDNFTTGNFEWWYFDIIDPQTDCILKIVAHLGTDPLRRKFFPQIAISLKTPDLKHSIIQICPLEEFDAANDECNVKIAGKFHCYVKKNDYHVWLDIPDLQGELTFLSQLPSWKPLGNEININRNSRSAAFGWIISVPKAIVNGIFIFKGKKYNVQNASGYHDHNFWKVGLTKKLFIDVVISKWFWGRFTAGSYTIIFMNTHIRNNQITSLYISARKKLIHSSNNATQFHINRQKMEPELKCLYPMKLTIKSSTGREIIRLVMKTREIIDRKDLLAEVNPVLRFLIQSLLSRPAYIGVEAECHLIHDNQNIHGFGIIESMLFRSK
jgi:hypothetical protein